MGVKGLLPLLKSIQKPCSLKQFQGQILGVDAYGWLHRGTISCAIELAQGKPTTKFVDFCMHRVRMLIHFGIRPYIVFDGDYLPSKKATEQGRASKRREARSAGLELLGMGKSAQAYQELQKSIDVTPEMARQFMDELDKAKIDFIVAPFEADAQLVYLEKKGVIHGIISEDSDMLVFGAKLLLTKLDQFGECVAIHRKDFTACKDISLVGWSDNEFRWMSILSGCDYLAPIGNVGLKTAYRLIRKHKTIERTIKAVQFDGKSKVPQNYLSDFRNADLTFLYQWVYCPVALKLVNLTTPPGDIDVSTLPFLGHDVDVSIAQQVARGLVHPHTKEPLHTTAGVAVRSKVSAKIPQAKTPALKKHQSIESFFKPRRTPLAELDPNLFTSSPSQQRLLDQQTQEVPINDRIPMPPPLARSVTDVQRPQSARRAVSDAWPTPRSTVSPKRLRLCSDSTTALRKTFGETTAVQTLCADSTLALQKTFGKASTERSRFFSTSMQSPSVLRAGRKESKTEKIDVWSDDSIEEAMMQIPDISSTAVKSRYKMKIFRDDAASSTPTAIEAVQSTDAKSPQGHIDNQPSAASHQLELWSSLQQSTYSAPTSFETRTESRETSQVDGKAESHLEIIAESPHRVPASSPPPETDEDRITEADWTAASTTPVISLSKSKDRNDPRHNEDQASTYEDSLIPDSDCEGDGRTEQPNSTSGPRFGLDLNKFVFVG